MSFSRSIKPFLLLQSRPEDVASDDEYEAFLRFSGLDEPQLERLRIESGMGLPTLNLGDYSGVLMGGGPANFAYSETDKPEDQKRMEAWLLPLLKEIISEDKPFLGACLGQGALIKIMGGVVSFDYSEPVEATEIVVSDEGRKDPILQSLPSSFYGFVGHKEGSVRAPSGVDVLARSNVCIQMIRIGSNVYATQFHPELDAEGLALRIETYKNAGYFEPGEADMLIEAARSAQVEHPVGILRNFTKAYFR